MLCISILYNKCRINEPYFFEETLNDAIYHNFLKNYLLILLENMELYIREQMWF